jgi:hypothetical protein
MLSFSNSEEPLFWLPALFGALLFLIQMLLALFGSFGDAVSDFDYLGIKWLSKHAFTGFIMMFGWAGLVCKQELDLSYPLSICCALTIGFLTLFLSGFLFRGATKLQSKGSVFCLEECIGKEATVYQRISPNAKGKVTVSLNQLTYEIDALSFHPEAIDSFTTVHIIHKHDETTVIVVPK